MFTSAAYYWSGDRFSYVRKVRSDALAFTMDRAESCSVIATHQEEGANLAFSSFFSVNFFFCYPVSNCCLVEA